MAALAVLLVIVAVETANIAAFVPVMFTDRALKMSVVLIFKTLVLVLLTVVAGNLSKLSTEPGKTAFALGSNGIDALPFILMVLLVAPVLDSVTTALCVPAVAGL